MDLINVYLTYTDDYGVDVMVAGTIDMDRVNDHKCLGEILAAFVYGNNTDYSQAGWGYIPFDFWLKYHKGAWLDDAPYYWVNDLPDGSLVWE